MFSRSHQAAGQCRSSHRGRCKYIRSQVLGAAIKSLHFALATHGPKSNLHALETQMLEPKIGIGKGAAEAT